MTGELPNGPAFRKPEVPNGPAYRNPDGSVRTPSPGQGYEPATRELIREGLLPDPLGALRRGIDATGGSREYEERQRRIEEYRRQQRS